MLLPQWYSKINIPRKIRSSKRKGNFAIPQCCQQSCNRAFSAATVSPCGGENCTRNSTWRWSKGACARGPRNPRSAPFLLYPTNHALVSKSARTLLKLSHLSVTSAAWSSPSCCVIEPLQASAPGHNASIRYKRGQRTPQSHGVATQDRDTSSSVEVPSDGITSRCPSRISG